MPRWRRDREAEMAEEMRLHVEHRIAQKIAAGHSPTDARAAALREFGNVESLKLTAREQRRSWPPTTMIRDVRFGLRVLRRSPGFALTAIMTLALGVGANVAVFSVLRGVLLEEPVYPDAQRVVHIVRDVEKMRGHSLTIADIDLARARTTVLQHLAASLQSTATLRGRASPERAYVDRVQPDYFSVYGVPPARGRTLGSEDFISASRAAVISDALWRRQFEASDDVLGQTLHVDDEAFTVVGVMPPDFVTDPSAAVDAEVWRPMVLAPGENPMSLRTVARLRLDASRPGAVAQLTATLPPRNVELFDGTIFKHRGVVVQPIGSAEAEAVRPGLLLLQGVAAFLLLIMCANLGNLFLAQASARRREFGVRTALGAGRARVVGQLLTEGVVVAAIGGTLAGVVALLAVPVLQILAGDVLPRTAVIAVRLPELTAALMLACTTAIVFAGVPAWLVSRADPLDAVRGKSNATPSPSARAFRATLVAVQVLLALVVLVGSGLLLRSFARVLAQPLGFDPAGLVSAQIQVPTRTAQPRDEALVFARRLEDELRQRLPAGSFTVGSDVPFSPQGNAAWKLVAPEGGPPKFNDMAYTREIATNALDFFGIAVVRGRGFLETDDSRSAPVAIVNETFARRFGGGADVLGATLDAGRNRPRPTIVGVVADVRSVALAFDAGAAVYLPFAQWSPPNLWIVTRGVSVDAAARAMRDAVRTVDANLPVTDIGTVEEKILRRERRRAFYLAMLCVFALLAVTLAAVGIYGVVAHVTARRGREMGVRLALGAKPRGLVRLVVQQSLLPVSLGLVAGIVVAWWSAKLLQNTPVFKAQLFQITAHDPATFLAAPGILLAVALIACWIPARRAGAANVVDVLKAE